MFVVRVRNLAALESSRLAQLVERKTLNLVVVGSSPTVGVVSFFLFWNLLNSAEVVFTNMLLTTARCPRHFARVVKGLAC